MKRMRVAWHTPLSREPFSRSEYFSKLILPLIADEFEIEIFTDGFESGFNLSTHHYLSSKKRHAQNPFDLFFYQVENGVHHHFLRTALGLYPGITLFHDYYLHDLGPDPLTNSPWEVVLAKLNDDSVSWPERSEEFPRKGPLPLRELALSQGKLFTSSRIFGDFERQFGKNDHAWFLPTPVMLSGDQPPTPSDRIRIGFCGGPNIEHRLHKLLLALHEVPFPFELSLLVEGDELEKAKAICKEFQLQKAEFVIGRNDASWQKLLSHIDIAFHGHFSVYGSSEPFLLQTLGAKRPAIITDIADASAYPSEVLFKVIPGETEAMQIKGFLQEILKRPSLFNNKAGRAFVEENHDASVVALELAIIFKHECEHLRTVSSRWNDLEQQAHESLTQEMFAKHFEANNFALKEIYRELGWS